MQNEKSTKHEHFSAKSYGKPYSSKYNAKHGMTVHTHFPENTSERPVKQTMINALADLYIREKYFER